MLNFVLTLCTAQTFNWAKNSNWSAKNECYGVSADQEGNVYTIGNFRPYNRSSHPHGSFIRKYDNEGNVILDKVFLDDSLGKHYFESIYAKDDGDFYVTGRFSGSVTIGDQTFTAKSDLDGFLAKFNTSGMVVWFKTFSDATNRFHSGLSLSGDDRNIYLLGLFIKDYSVENNKNSLTIDNCFLQGYNECTFFVAKINESGSCSWLNSIEGTVFSHGYGIQNDSSGNIYITGSFYYTAKFDSINLIATTTYRGVSTENIFIAKLNPLGKFLWAKGIGGGIEDVAYSISVDKMGNSYLTGYVSDTAYFDSILVTGVNSDYFVAKYDSSGKCRWAVSRGTPNDNYGYTISADDEGNSYVGSNLRFITKYDRDGNIAWDLPLSGAIAKKSCMDGKGNLIVSGHLYDHQANFGNITLENVSSGGDFFITRIKVGEAPSAIQEPNKDESGFVLYPNPAGSSFFVRTLLSGGASGGSMLVKVHNPLGETVYECRYDNCDQPLQIDLGSRSKGIYFVELVTGKKKVVKKVVLQ